MTVSPLPPPEAVREILIWHQGALGDLLLAGPALAAISRHYPAARLTGLGHPERWRLLAATLPLAAAWNSGAAQWAPLFHNAPLPLQVQARLASFQVALVFTPRPAADLQARLAQAGIAAVGWVPSFPDAAGEAVGPVQARHLTAMGIESAPQPFRLQISRDWEDAVPVLPGPGPWLAVAPGSGHPHKNWPLSHYYEVTRTLAWEHKLGVVWLAGPAEAHLLPYLEGLASAQGHLVLAGLPLTTVAAVLARCRLYLGNDSGLTHLAAAVGVPAVLALFGPTDPRIWAPQGRQVRILAAPCPQAPCAQGREIACDRPQCLQDLSPEAVGAVATEMLAGEKFR